MTAFDPAANPSTDLAFALLSNSPVTMFWRAGVLDDAVRQLESDGYQLARLAASAWTTQSMHD